MLPAVIASAIAARDLGYPSIAALIVEKQLGPQAIARMFAMSVSNNAGHAAAVVILAAATAQFNACRQGFDGSVERDLAIEALGDEALFAAANREAVKLVKAHWREITAEVQSPAISPVEVFA